ncbi:putative proteasome inhibitor [Nymphaea thermarum]|nr:putative proteasome inhibitor [Nymphaea thermarum]
MVEELMDVKDLAENQSFDDVGFYHVHLIIDKNLDCAHVRDLGWVRVPVRVLVRVPARHISKKLGFLEVPAPSQDFEVVIRASRPSFRNDHDKVAFLAHASFLSADYVLTTAGKAALGETPVVPK